MQHPLASYLRDHGITQAAFAERLGVNQATVSKICAGRSGVSLRMALKIEAETGGSVSAAALLPDTTRGAA